MPIRYLLRHKLRKVQFVEATCTDIDPVNKTIMVQDESEVRGEVTNTRIKYDFLVVASGAQNATFGIKGVEEYACFLKETWDARKIRQKLMDCLETACFPGQSDSEISRILHMVVVGGGPTGVEYAAELHDFLHDDLSTWYPEITSKIKITLVEALPHVLPMFSSELIKYTEAQFAKDKIEIMNNTMVKEIREKEIVVRHKNGEEVVVPYGLLVWATGNTARPHVAGLIRKLDPSVQNQRRGLVVDEYMAVKGAKGIFALGDCTATKFPPTAQVATRQGAFLAKYFNNLGQMSEDVQEQYANGELGSQLSGSYPSFEYSHVGTLAYIGSDRAIADLPGGVHLGGILTFFFWRSVYLSNLFTVRNRVLVVADWIKMRTFGRDIARE
ncbi:NADH:ubiquinone oxidoreductase [Nowakowskiella sp. JEL0407]|nr:NADH:ubiquinone oxidoreductase [Nowakowskiella sp. JEL0407]